MMRVLSEEEAKESNKEVDQWLMALDYNTKYKIMSMIKPFQKQATCSHDWIDPNSYENKMPKNKLFCRLCHLTKEIEK